MGQTPFVLTDGSYAGLGKTGAAHLLPPQEPSYRDLQRSLNSMINYNLFGMPNVGPSLCNFEIMTESNEELCGRYFQLAIISPLSVFVSPDLFIGQNNHPFLFRMEVVK